jgi:hypothetical protein
MGEVRWIMSRAEKALFDSRGHEKVTIKRDDLLILRVLAETYLVTMGRIDELSPMVGGINHDTTMTTGDGEHSEGDSGTHP